MSKFLSIALRTGKGGTEVKTIGLKQRSWLTLAIERIFLTRKKTQAYGRSDLHLAPPSEKKQHPVVAFSLH
jgi:hypothetical protein